MFSAGVHGSIPCVQKTLENLFNKHTVTAYFSGHDHNLQVKKTQTFYICFFPPRNPFKVPSVALTAYTPRMACEEEVSELPLTTRSSEVKGGTEP